MVIFILVLFLYIRIIFKVDLFGMFVRFVGLIGEVINDWIICVLVVYILLLFMLSICILMFVVIVFLLLLVGLLLVIVICKLCWLIVLKFSFFVSVMMFGKDYKEIIVSIIKICFINKVLESKIEFCFLNLKLFN